MNKDKRELFLFTISFPYGNAETFLENEICVLAERFSKIYVFPMLNSGIVRELPVNVEIVNWQESYSYNRIVTYFSNFSLFKKIIKGERSELKSALLQNFARAKAVKSFLLKKSEAVFYSFWFDDWATILGILKKQGVINKFYSRTHGFDLYTEYRPHKSIPFRRFQLETVDKVIAVSKDGYNYLNQKYPDYSSKFSLSHLGVFDRGINPFVPNQNFTIVSCSNIARIKRLHLAIEVLQFVKCKVKWIHFGDGEVQNEIITMSRTLPSNVTVDFRGRVSNRELVRFYQSNPVSLFMQFSESEGGVPVSLQEAASFGIPLLGTDVGGIPEIIGLQTGNLIPKNFDIEKTAQWIDDFQNSKLNSQEFRAGVRKFWMENFEANRNYNLFCDELAKP